MSRVSKPFKHWRVRLERVIDSGGSWNTHLPLVKFSYNNSYHSSSQCTLFEVLYECKSRSFVVWAEIGLKSVDWTEIVHKAIDQII